MGFHACNLAMRRALAANRGGRPMAVRLLDGTVPPTGGLEQHLAERLAEAANWLGDQAERLTVLGSPQSGHLAALAVLANGQSMVVSVWRARKTPLIEARVYGSHGVLSWSAEGAAATTTDGPSGDATRLSAWLDLVRASLQAGSSVATGGTPAQSVPSQHPWPTPADAPWTMATAPRQTPPPPWGVLLISGDHTHQPGYASALAGDQRCRLVGLTDTPEVPPERQRWNKQLADRLGIPVLPDWEAAIERPDVHIVSICAEPYRRAKIICRAAEAGKHLYLDKPLCARSDEAASIVSVVRRHGVLAHMFSQVHWEPASRARLIVSDDAWSEPCAAHFEMCFAKGHAGTADLTARRREVSQPDRYEVMEAKRELTNVGVYEVVRLLWLFRRNVRRVFASTGNYFFREHQQQNMEDFGQILLELDGGLIATVTAGRTGWYSHPGSGWDQTLLISNQDAAVVDGWQPHVSVWDDQGAWTAPPPDPEDPMAMWFPDPDSPYRAAPKEHWFRATDPTWEADSSAFLDCLERGQASAVSAELSAMATTVLLAAYQSAAERTTVELKP